VSGGVGQPKRHHQILIEAISGTESSLEDIFFMDLDLMITLSKINLGEHLRSNQLINKKINARQCIFFLDNHRIEWSVIDTHTHCLILLLLHKESEATPW
jgi:hypothetical protein